MKFNKFAIAALAIGLSSATLAQSIGKPEDQIRWRQSVMQTLGWSMDRIKANIEGTYNKDQVIQAGTDKGKGWRETNVKPEFLKPENKDEIGKLAGAYIK